MNKEKDPPTAEKLQPGDELTADEREFLGIYRKINPTGQKALIAALRAAPGDRYQAALSVLAEVYEEPTDAAQSAATLADLLTGVGWNVPEPEGR